MKIALIAPRLLPVPPVNYGGTERVIYYLAEELVRRGHQVLLFAPRGSRSSAKLYEYPSAGKKRVLRFIMRHLPGDVDLIHDHDGLVAKSNPSVPTLRQSHMQTLIKKAQIPVYVSKTILRTGGKGKGYVIPNGIDVNEYEFREKKDDYLLFIGRISHHKGVHHAIEVAKATGRKLIIAGLQEEDLSYYHEQIEPQLNSRILYVGNVGGKRKQELLSKAYCVLFPSIWNEPFGLVLIEALACGTPVLGLRYGAVPEVLSGFPELVCQDPMEMAGKVNSGHSFPSPAECRKYVETRHSHITMADAALKLYRRVLRGKNKRRVTGINRNKR